MSSYPSDLNEKSELISFQRPQRGRTKSMRCLSVLGAIFILLAIIVLITVFALVIQLGTQSNDTNGASATFTKAAVAADAGVCSTAGTDILKKGGSAVDAAIAAHLCLGVVNLHSTGIGGGGFMVFYNASSGESHALDFREVAASNASTYMYNNTADDAHRRGGLAMAVPGELRGMELAWKRFGRLEWTELFEPAVRVASDGIVVSSAVGKAISAAEKYLLSGDYPGLKELLAPDDKILVEGDILKRPVLAQTLHDIGEKGADYFYEGAFAEEMITELQERNSIISLQDLKDYEVVERDVTKAKYKGQDVLGISAPGGGPVLGLILNILDGYNFTSDDLGGLSLHRIIEAMKFTYAQRLKLGDPAFNDSVSKVVDFMLNKTVAMEMFERIDDSMTFDPDHYIDPFNTPLWAAHDGGTSHLSVLASNGDAVAMTNSINSYFGCLIRSQRNGIIFNDLMSDFSIPGRNGDFEVTDANLIQPGKRPLSSMTPTIVTENGEVKLVVGASGGSRITTSVAQVTLDVLGFSLPISESIPRPRFHHQLIPNQVSVETDYPDDLIQSLESRGHKVIVGGSNAVVQGIHVDKDLIHATCDPRKGGIPDGY